MDLLHDGWTNDPSSEEPVALFQLELGLCKCRESGAALMWVGLNFTLNKWNEMVASILGCYVCVFPHICMYVGMYRCQTPISGIVSSVSH